MGRTLEVGTLVWLRRPNGSWWPGRVASPLDFPDAPPRSSATTPIVLLGRRDGAGFVDWCNLDRTNRVKPFRCGELDFEESIRKAEDQVARRRLSNRTRDKMLAVTARYARRDDAIVQALDIERARATAPDNNRTKSRLGNGVTRKTSQFSAAVPSSTAVNPQSPERKRKTPTDSEDDVPQGIRRMRDLTDIESNTLLKHVPNADTFAVLNYSLPSTSQVKRSRHSHHSAAKRKPAIVDQDQPCGLLRKKDRSRPLSELCNGDMWNRFRSNGSRADQHLMDTSTCSGSSTTTSSLDTLLDMPSSHRTSLLKAGQAKGTEITCMTGLACDEYPHEDEPVNAPLAAGSIFKADHLHAHPPCDSTKDPIWKCSKQATDCSKADISSLGDDINYKKKTISSVDHEGSNRTRNTSEGEHHKTTVVKHEAPGNEVVMLEVRLGKSSFDERAEPGDYKDLAIIHRYLDCVDAVVQQCPERKCDTEEPTETVTNRTNCEIDSASSLVFELPLEVLPPQHREPVVARYNAVKPTKTLSLNYSLYDVEVSAQGSSSTKGRHVPLVSLMSRWNRRPVVGYPVSVEVLDVICCPLASSIDDHRPSTSSGNGILKKDEAAVPRCARPSSQKGRVKHKSCRKASEDEMDKSWRPHARKPMSSPRKMRRLSSFTLSRRRYEDVKSVVEKFSGPAIACIPLRIVFSRINEALTYPVK